MYEVRSKKKRYAKQSYPLPFVFASSSNMSPTAYLGCSSSSTSCDGAKEGKDGDASLEEEGASVAAATLTSSYLSIFSLFFSIALSFFPP